LAETEPLLPAQNRSVLQVFFDPLSILPTEVAHQHERSSLVEDVLPAAR
jgi:hypothetical protein